MIPAELVAEFAATLATLATARPQQSMAGLSIQERASAILWHIARQRGNEASRLILGHAAAVLAFSPMPTSSPMFLKVQVGKSIYSLLRADYLTLFGKRVSYRISFQSRYMALALFNAVEPVLRFWLRDGGQRAIAEVVTSSKVKP